MKIRSILNEDVFQSFDSGAISAFQVAMLRKLIKGNVDPLNGLSPKAEEAINGLMDLGLVDSGYEVTSAGLRTLDIASKVATPELKSARQKGALRREISSRERPEPVVDVDVDFDDSDDLVAGEPEEMTDDEDLGGTLRVEKPSKVRKNQVKDLSGDDLSSFDDDIIDDEGEYRWDK